MNTQSPIPIAVTIAGSDSSGGAGIQADLKTFSALGVYGASVITALTAQNTRGVTGIHDVPSDFVTAQMDAVFSDLSIGAVKIGMVSWPQTADAIADGLIRHSAKNVVFDPVMVAASGDPLIAEAAVEVLKARLFPIADLITPNLPEAARLLKTGMAEDEDQMADQGRALMDLGARAVLIKGGHGEGPEAVDILVHAAGTERFAAPRLWTGNTHGTGCTLSSAIAAALAKGETLSAAAGTAKAYLSAALAAADTLSIGRGAGPVHHFHASWEKA